MLVSVNYPIYTLELVPIIESLLHNPTLLSHCFTIPVWCILFPDVFVFPNNILHYLINPNLDYGQVILLAFELAFVFSIQKSICFLLCPFMILPFSLPSQTSVIRFPSIHSVDMTFPTETVPLSISLWF